MSARHEIVIVGAGQSGLSLSAALSAAGREHLVLERGRIGQAWRDRWESFRLVGPAKITRLHGFAYDGPEPDAFPTRSEVVALLEQYAAARRSPVREGVSVAAVIPLVDGGFRLLTSDGPMEAQQVVLASGTYARAHRPAIAAAVAARLPIVSVQDYRSPDGLPEGAVLVVGAGQSACQIAEELHLSGRRVVLACGRAGWAPRRIAGRDCFEWLLETAFARITVDQLPTPAGRFFANPQLSGQAGGHDLHYRTLAALGLELAGHVTGVDGGTVRFADDLADSVAWGDLRYGELRALVLGRMAEVGVPASDLDDPAPWRFEGLADLPVRDVGVVVLATGFRPDYASLVPVPDAFDGMGFPLQRDGTSTVVPGLHFLGVHYQRTRLSATLMGIGEDASVLADRLIGAPIAA